MNMKNLQYILSVCQEGSITAAAHAQRVSQPALSQAVKQEEQALGTPIFLIILAIDIKVLLGSVQGHIPA